MKNFCFGGSVRGLSISEDEQAGVPAPSVTQTVL